MAINTVRDHAADPDEAKRRSVGSRLIDSLAARDFDTIAAALEPDVRMRGLVPSGPSEWNGRQSVAAAFASWFGAADNFEIIHSEIAEVAGRLHLAWRARVRPAPYEGGEGWHVIEQHFLADITDSIDALDFLCTGFRREAPEPRKVS